MSSCHLFLAALSALGPDSPGEPRLDLITALAPDEMREEDEQANLHDINSREAQFGDFSSEGWRFGASVAGMYYPGVDFDSASGDVTTQRYRARLSASQPLDEKRRMTYALTHEQSSYDFDGANLGGIPDPFDRVFQTTLSASFQTRESEDVSWFVNGFARMGAESGADFDDATVYGGGAVVTFPAWENFRLSVGGFVTSRLEDDAFFFPWFQIDWQVTERLSVGQEGSGVGIGYLFSDRLKSYGNLFYNVRQYRFDDDAPIPGGVGRDDEFGVNLGLLYTASERVRWDFFGGINLREITLIDSGGSGVQDELDPAPYIGVSVSYLF